MRGYRLSRCRAFVPVPGPLQTVRLQAFWHDLLCNDNPVVRAVGRLLDHGGVSTPLPLVHGDLCAIVQHMIRARGVDTVTVTKVKGHAAEVDGVGLVMLRLTLLLTWVGVISLR